MFKTAIKESKDVTYFYDRNRFLEKYKQFSKVGKVYYPIKTCSNPFVIKSLVELDSCFEVDSIEHMKLLVDTYNVSPSKILYNNVFRTEEDVRVAAAYGIRTFAVKSITQLHSVQGAIGAEEATYLIRINMSDFFENLDFSTKRFGTTLNSFSNLLDAIDRNHNKVGISFHTSNIEGLAKGIARENGIATIINGISSYLKVKGETIDILDIGGGHSLSDFHSIELADAIDRFKKEQKTKIIIESGTGLVADCFDEEARIIDVVEDAEYIESLGRKQAITGICMAQGIFSGLLDYVLMKKEYQFELRENNDSKSTVALEPFRGTLNLGNKLIYLFGPTQAQEDNFGYYQVPSDTYTTITSTIVIKNVGAYNESLTTNFLGGITSESKVVRKSYK